MRDGYFHWGRRTRPKEESQWVSQRFWQGARHRFVQSMFLTPTTEQTRAQWVRQVHAWFQTVVKDYK